MELINPEEIKKLKKAREIIIDLQSRLFKAENCLDDLSRAVEIATFTKQFQVVDAFVRDAGALLEDRLVLPEIEQGDQKYTIIEGSISEETAKQIREKQQDKAS